MLFRSYGAKEEIVKGIQTLNKIPEIDLIIAGRGGGSIEDLWAFNEEEVVRAFYESEKPIISAVGHEIDNLLSDLSADVRAATPTQAIEIAIPVKKDIEKNLYEKGKKIRESMNRVIKSKNDSLNRLKESYILKNFQKNVNEKNQDLILKETELENTIKKILERKQHELDLKIEKIVSLNPVSILRRGYSITKIERNVIKDTDNLKKGDLIETVFSKGKVLSKIEEIIE